MRLGQIQATKPTIQLETMRVAAVERIILSEQVIQITVVGRTADIDMSEVCGKDGKSWIPIGYENEIEYNGTFDGDGHTIHNLYFVKDEEMWSGGPFC